MRCEHIDYDDYFEECLDCGMTGEQIHTSECVAAAFEITEDGVCSRCGTIFEGCEIVMERSMNEQWGVTDDGECDFSDFQGDGGASEFSNYLCITHDYSSENWEDMQRHKKEEQSKQLK